MARYHIATGDGKAYYGVNYESYREAKAVLEFSQKRDPQAHIVKEEYHFTNADRIRAMSDEELANEMLFFCPTDTIFKGEDTYGKPHYTGLDGGYYATSEEVVASNLEWLKQPAEG